MSRGASCTKLRHHTPRSATLGRLSAPGRAHDPSADRLLEGVDPGSGSNRRPTAYKMAARGWTTGLSLVTLLSSLPQLHQVDLGDCDAVTEPAPLSPLWSVCGPWPSSSLPVSLWLSSRRRLGHGSHRPRRPRWSVGPVHPGSSGQGFTANSGTSVRQRSCPILCSSPGTTKSTSATQPPS